ncbi:MAG: tetratricopeptide repeat protein [Planctomycetes bacterium]|nr:tetratricopeptide repeat protein [Planctomycetota bacterium]
MKDPLNTLRQAVGLYREADLPRAQMLLESLDLDDLDKDLQLEAHYLWGRVMSARGDWPEAATHFQACLKLKPGWFAALEAWGNVLVASGDPRAAIDKYKRALAAAPANQATHVMFNYGAVLMQHGYASRAIGKFRECFRRNPRDPDAARAVGDCYLRMKRPRGALKWLKAALKLNPRDVRTLVALGNALGLNGKRELAYGCFERALQLDANCAIAHYDWAVLLAAEKKWQESIRHAKEGLRLQPESCRLLCHHLFCLRQLGAFDAALHIAKRARALVDRADAEDRRGETADLVVMNQAACLHGLGRNVAARETLVEFLRRTPDPSPRCIAQLRFIDKRPLKNAQRIELTMRVEPAPPLPGEEPTGPPAYERTYWVIAENATEARRLARRLEPTDARVRFQSDLRVVETLTNADEGVGERSPIIAIWE